jgi:glutamyl-tRNA synthetase
MPDAIKKMIIDIGPKTSDVTLSWENLYAYNRKILDPTADRYFFVNNPIELTIRGVPKLFDARLKLHPDEPGRGFREYTVQPQGEDDHVTLWVSRKDVDSSSVGATLRLMDLFNVKIENANVYSAQSLFISESYEDARKTKAQLIQWVLIGQDMPCRVVMSDASVAEGVAESACKRLKPNDMIQFERFGFVRVDEINDGLTAYFAQK